MMNIAQVMPTGLDIFKGQDVDSTNDIIPVEFNDKIYKKSIAKSAFLDFLRSEGVLKGASSSKVTFPVKKVADANRAKIATNEDATDVTGTDVDWSDLPYVMATVAKRIKATDLAIEGNTYIDPFKDDMEDAYPDVLSAIEEQIIKNGASTVPNKMDNLNQSTPTTASKITTELVDTAIDAISQNSSVEADFIVGSQTAIRQIINSDPNADKIFNASETGNYVGRWSKVYDTPSGPVPLIVSKNFNARLGTPGPNGVLIGSSEAIGFKQLKNSYFKEIPTTGFSREGLLGNFVAVGKLDDAAFKTIVNS
ncbi:MAG: hypothetical protein ACRC1M_05770 [Methanobacteriaceae archaeon]